MFTGLIREIAIIENFNNSILQIKSKYQPKIGDSIAVNGACLTVVAIDSEYFSVELSPESESYLALENYKIGNSVHIEPAMMMGDRFEGHIVQGHIDEIGTIQEIINNGNSFDYIISIDKKSMQYIVPKGSVTVDGVSLTVNDKNMINENFRLTIIPHTVKNTLFQKYKVGDRVNIETDMFARYVEAIFSNRKNNKISWQEIDNILMSY